MGAALASTDEFFLFSPQPLFIHTATRRLTLREKTGRQQSIQQDFCPSASNGRKTKHKIGRVYLMKSTANAYSINDVEHLVLMMATHHQGSDPLFLEKQQDL